MRTFLQDDTAQDLIEYGLLAALISVGSVALILAVGGSLNVLWSSFPGKLP